MEHLGASRKPTGGFGLTVKWRNTETHSLSVRMPDWAGPCANSSMVIRGKRILVSTWPKTERLFSVVTGRPWRRHSASDHLRRTGRDLDYR